MAELLVEGVCQIDAFDLFDRPRLLQCVLETIEDRADAARDEREG